MAMALPTEQPGFYIYKDGSHAAILGWAVQAPSQYDDSPTGKSRISAPEVPSAAG